MGSPVSANYHGTPHFRMITWLGGYQAQTPGVGGCDNTTVRLDDENEPQPDGQLRILTSHGGRSFVDEAGYIVGGPELAGEVAARIAPAMISTTSWTCIANTAFANTWSGASTTPSSIGLFCEATAMNASP